LKLLHLFYQTTDWLRALDTITNQGAQRQNEALLSTL
jgi:hypothetical protein